MQSSKAQNVNRWICITIVLGALVLAEKSNAQWWNPFGPSDYEECSEKAAIDAKSSQALQILLRACEAKFAGRRKLCGGYTFYDARQNRYFDINGPNPSKKEAADIEADYSSYVENQKETAEALRKAEQQAAILADRMRQQAEIRERQQIEENRRAEATLLNRKNIALQGVKIMSQSIKCDYPFLVDRL